MPSRDKRPFGRAVQLDGGRRRGSVVSGNFDGGYHLPKREENSISGGTPRKLENVGNFGREDEESPGGVRGDVVINCLSIILANLTKI